MVFCRLGGMVRVGATGEKSLKCELARLAQCRGRGRGRARTICILWGAPGRAGAGAIAEGRAGAGGGTVAVLLAISKVSD